MAKKKDVEDASIQVLEISKGRLEIRLVGTKPLYYNAPSAKAWRDLLLPSGRKTAAEKASNLKHNPIEEFRQSLYTNPERDCETRLRFPSPAIKGATMTAALDIPGAKKAEVGRLVWIENYSIGIYGIPRLKMDWVRSADMNKTPDVRTRGFLVNWCTDVVSVSFVQPKMTARSVLNLIAAGGFTAGIGDFRQEKGKGSFGQYRLADADDEMAEFLIKNCGRDAQDEAIENVKCADALTEELLSWYYTEVERRGREKQTAPKVRKLRAVKDEEIVQPE